MHRNQNQDRGSRPGAERDASQPIAGQPAEEGHEHEHEHEHDDDAQVPSFLTAEELRARAPAKPQETETAREPGPKKSRKSRDESED